MSTSMHRRAHVDEHAATSTCRRACTDEHMSTSMQRRAHGASGGHTRTAERTRRRCSRASRRCHGGDTRTAATQSATTPRRTQRCDGTACPTLHAQTRNTHTHTQAHTHRERHRDTEARSDTHREEQRRAPTQRDTATSSGVHTVSTATTAARCHTLPRPDRSFTAHTGHRDCVRYRTRPLPVQTAWCAGTISDADDDAGDAATPADDAPPPPPPPATAAADGGCSSASAPGKPRKRPSKVLARSRGDTTHACRYASKPSWRRRRNSGVRDANICLPCDDTVLDVCDAVAIALQRARDAAAGRPQARRPATTACDTYRKRRQAALSHRVTQRFVQRCKVPVPVLHDVLHAAALQHLDVVQLRHRHAQR